MALEVLDISIKLSKYPKIFQKSSKIEGGDGF